MECGKKDAGLSHKNFETERPPMPMPSASRPSHDPLGPVRRAAGRRRESQNEGGLPGPRTERPPMPMPSAFTPSTGGGRFWTGSQVRACASPCVDFALAAEAHIEQI